MKLTCMMDWSTVNWDWFSQHAVIKTEKVRNQKNTNDAYSWCTSESTQK